MRPTLVGTLWLPESGEGDFFAQRPKRTLGVLLVNRYSSIGVGSSSLVKGAAAGAPS